jgi:hypothetical protein
MARLENGKWNIELSRSYPLRRVASLARGSRERVISPEAGADRDHFYKCPACGQQVDRRQLGEVLHHEVPEHKALPARE